MTPLLSPATNGSMSGNTSSASSSSSSTGVVGASNKSPLATAAAASHVMMLPLGTDANDYQGMTGHDNDAHNSNNNADADVAAATAASTAGGGGGSSVPAVIFNFTNCIVGAGAIGLGGAMAQSGGIISIVTILAFAYLTKVSLDLVIHLSVTTGHDSYEALGQAALGGTWGRWMVVACKFLYSFGCLIAYVIVVKDNFGPAVHALLYGNASDDNDNSSEDGLWFHFWKDDALVTWTVSTLIILPLCLLRDMTPLASLSFLSVVAMVVIVVILLYLYIADPDQAIRHDDVGTFYQHWFQIHWENYWQCLGTFVFTFVSQHTVHLTFASLRRDLRTVPHWNIVSTVTLGIAATISLSVAVVVYMSFWETAKSDIFQIYPSIPVVNFSKMLLCITMFLTFPLPFFTCRELIILTFFGSSSASSDDNDCIDENGSASSSSPSRQLLEPLLSAAANTEDEQADGPVVLMEVGGVATEQQPQLAASKATEGTCPSGGNVIVVEHHEDDGVVESSSHDHHHNPTSPSGSSHSPSLFDINSVLSSTAALSRTLRNACLLEDDAKQLKLPYHVVVTCKLWFVATGLAIAAPSLGDVLNLVGCATGTLIAFVFPACMALRLQPSQQTSQGGNVNSSSSTTATAWVLLFVGLLVGVVGTYCSLKQLWQDLFTNQQGKETLTTSAMADMAVSFF